MNLNYYLLEDVILHFLFGNILQISNTGDYNNHSNTSVQHRNSINSGCNLNTGKCAANITNSGQGCRGLDDDTLSSEASEPHSTPPSSISSVSEDTVSIFKNNLIKVAMAIFHKIILCEFKNT